MKAVTKTRLFRGLPLTEGNTPMDLFSILDLVQHYSGVR